jgi:hypothetical protein
MYNADEHNQKLAEQDEKWGLGRLSDDGSQIIGGFRNELERLANSDNKEVIAALADAGVTSPRVPRRFYLSNSQEAVVWADDAGWHSAAIFNGEQINFSAATRDEVLMLPERHLQQNSGPHFKEISEAQKLNVVRLAQNRDVLTALGSYLYFRIGDEATDMHPEEIASNPKFLPVMNEAVYFVFRHANNAYFPTPEAEASLAKFAGDRPLTLALCNAWWLAYQDDIGQRRAAQAPAPEKELVPSQEEVTAEMETLGDSALEKLRSQTMRKRAQEIRRFNDRIYGR